MLEKEELVKLQDVGISTTDENVQCVLNTSYVRLFPFQKEGVLRMLLRGERCCLFDESGLGKSIQALVAVFLRCFTDNCFSKGGIVLIVCPSILKINWWTMIEEWLPMLDVDDVLMLASKKDILTLSKNGNKRKVLIVSYASVAVIFQYPSLRIHTLILDESHLTKNFLSKRTLAIASLRAKHVLLLSGTPIQNKPIDLMSQVVLSLSKAEIQLLNKDSPFDPKNDILESIFEVKDFYFIQKYFSKNKKQCHNRAHIEKSSSSCHPNGLSSSDLKTMRKSLPLFVDFVTSCFDAIGVSGPCKHHFFVEIKRKHFQFCGDSFKRETLVSFAKGMASFRNLFSIELERSKAKLEFLFCCHQLLWIHCGISVKTVRGKRFSKMIINYGNAFSTFFNSFLQSRVIRRLRSEVKLDLPQKLVKMHFVSSCDGRSGVNVEGFNVSESLAITVSTDLKVFAELLGLPIHETIAELKRIAFQKIPSCVEYICSICAVAEKCVVFATHQEVLDVLLLCLNKELPGNEVLCVTGTTKPDERLRTIHRFDSSKSHKILLLSTGANSAGFNLKSVSRVIFCELSWCSEKMQQAEDRAMRLGQSNNILYVTYLILRHSFEEMLLIILRKRKNSFRKVLGDMNWEPNDSLKEATLHGKECIRDVNLKNCHFSDQEIACRINTFTNRVHVYIKAPKISHWRHTTMNFDFVNCLQLCILVDDVQERLKTFLHSFALEWTQLSGKEKKILTEPEMPLTLPLRHVLIGCKEKPRNNKYDNINSFERHTHPDHQMHVSAKFRVLNGMYTVKTVLLRSNESVHVAWNNMTEYFMCKYCGLDLKWICDKPSLLEELFCSANVQNCLLKFMLKCCGKKARIVLRDFEHGVCRSCKVDTLHLLRECKKFSRETNARMNAITCSSVDAVGNCSHSTLNDNNDMVKKHWTTQQVMSLSQKRKSCIENSHQLKESHFWEADHILAVKLGGPSIIDNFQTLCVVCHAKKTKKDGVKIRKLKMNERQKEF